MKNKTLILIGIFLLCMIPSLWGVMHAGFFVSDDGHWMAIRLSAFYEALASGQFPVRFLPRINQGIGYPVADFLYPLFLYVGSFLHLVKIPFVMDIKILFGVGVVASGLGMALFLRKQFSLLPSLFGGLVYVYLPYHLYDVYSRGSLGEVLALAIIPFVLWAIEKKSWMLTGLFVGLLILSHNTLALFFLPLAIIYAWIRRISLVDILRFTVAGLCLSAFFWAPALFDKQYTVFDTIAVSNPFGYFVNETSYQLVGWIGIVIFGGILSFRSFVQKREVLFFFLVGIISLFFSMSLSSIFWHSRFLAEFVQFPFRFLSLTLVAEAFLAAYIVEKLHRNKPLLIVILLLLGFSSWPYLFPHQYDYYPDSYYSTNVDTTTVKNEYMPLWVMRPPLTYISQRVSIAQKEGTALSVMEKGTHLSFTGSMRQVGDIQIAYAYFPGWYALVDGKNISVAPSKDGGLLQLHLSKGVHQVRVLFGETPFRLVADAFSLITILLLTGLFFYGKKYKKI